MLFDRDAIYVDDQGRPIPRPERDEFSPDIEGTIAFMRAGWAWEDKIRNMSSQAFDQAFRRALCQTQQR